MTVLPSFVRRWSSSKRFLRGGAGSSVLLRGSIRPCLGGARSLRGCRRFFSVLLFLGLRFVPFCRLWAAVLAVGLGAKLHGAGRAGASVCREACLEESSGDVGTARRFKRGYHGRLIFASAARKVVATVLRGQPCTRAIDSFLITSP